MRATVIRLGYLMSGIVAMFIVVGCTGLASPTPKAPSEQDLKITLGGFVQGGNEQERVDGVCGPENTRNILDCDIYNGLSGWTITEVILRVVLSPYEYGEDKGRDYRIAQTIKPLTTEHVRILLGMQLPPDELLSTDHGLRRDRVQHWGWVVVGAKGRRSTNH